MTANFNPVYGLTPSDFVGGGSTVQNIAMDGTGTVTTLFTAGVNGAYVKRIRVKGLATNGASVARIFLNNGSTNATASNNALWGELPLAATSASSTAATGPDFEYPVNKVIQASYVVNICYGTAGISPGWAPSIEAMSY